MTGSLTHLGTATTLLSYAGITVLTDPNFLHRGQRAYLGKGLWSQRRTEPAMQPRDLPPLDAIVLSHLHGDHFDRIARQQLPRDVPLLTTRPAARRLRQQGFAESVALDTWTSTEISRGTSRLRVTAVPGRHAPGPLRALLPAVMGSVLEFSAPGERDLAVYITGDTLLVPELAEIPRRHPHLDLGLFHLGGTRIPFGRGVLVTMDAKMGADLLELVHPVRTVPIHNDDYGVFTSPRSAFVEETTRRGLSGVHPVEPGVAVPLPLA